MLISNIINGRFEGRLLQGNLATLSPSMFQVVFIICFLSQVEAHNIPKHNQIRTMSTTIFQNRRPQRRSSQSSCGSIRSTRRPSLMRRSKSNDDEGGSMRHLVDYSKKRATHDAKNRSSCRGPAISRQMYEGNSPNKNKNISARDLDWGMLSQTMDLSNESIDSPVRRGSMDNSSQDEMELLQQRPQMSRRSLNCSARLRVNLARSASCRPPLLEDSSNNNNNSITESIPAPTAADDNDFWGEENSSEEEIRPSFGRSQSVGTSLFIRRSPVSFNAKFA
ncbi:expressed unknown protein [Seminavis robusta]|uniref:Uncharacterized protein n=1 Tax=Seminavis robusta TaxID=568900 RepID=A0A9N8DKG8_9STRA|nr:expressed unknown protein [Seminavis robusta]|eukprot:Sro194_g082770.1 n/a (279) ;mRNA; f:32719-33555